MATAFTLDQRQRAAPPLRAVPVTEEDVRNRIDITLPRKMLAILPDAGQRVLAQGHRRATILAAARALFDEGGSSGVTVRRLAARSGVAAPTIYAGRRTRRGRRAGAARRPGHVYRGSPGAGDARRRQHRLRLC
ncbi:helix-turn-helix domain-containing protein [Sphingobium aromaticiconvertens]|uniref:helix-turn-helix domain-containing protein n=1 Tax=Sphingobium aromaticiconvertens TaxID=365341 RepID=UPI0030196539